MNAALRILTWLLALALVALPVVAVVNGWIGAERWPLSKLRVQGELTRVDPAQLQATVLPYAKRGFFAVRLEDAKRAVEQLPWVERADVRKRWPDVLEVRITEHKPFARWGNDKLLSEHGRLFPMPKELTGLDLPQLGGPESQVQEVTALCDSIVILGRGRVIASGTAADLVAQSGETLLEDAFVRLLGSGEGLAA